MGQEKFRRFFKWRIALYNEKGRRFGSYCFLKFESPEKGKAVDEKEWDSWCCGEEDFGIEMAETRKQS